MEQALKHYCQGLARYFSFREKNREWIEALKRPRRHASVGEVISSAFPRPQAKPVDFVEMSTSEDFPCIEVAFEDKTALLFELGTRITMEPMYSNWKTGNQRVLRRWPLREIGG